MRNKRLLLALMLILVMATVGCGNKEKTDVEVSGEETDEKTEVKEESTTDEKKSENTNTEKNDSTPGKEESTSNKNQTNKNESTGNSNTTTKPSNGSNNTTTKPSNSGSTTNNSGSNNSGSGNTGNSNNSGSSNNNSSNTGSTGTTTQPSTPVHEHSWTEVTEDEIHYYAWRTICGKCGEDLTDLGSDGKIYHSAAVCYNGYTVKFVEVDYVTENVVKTPVVVGYKCTCGAEKK